MALPPEADRTALARDAVRAEARPAPGPAYDGSRCPAGVAAAPTPAGAVAPARLVHGSGDPIAAALSARLVALARNGGDAGSWVAAALGGAADVRSVGLAGGAFASALEAGEGAGFVVPVDLPAGDPCAVLAAIVTAAPWLASVPATASPGTLHPLIETRPVWVSAERVTGLTLDAGGVLRLEGVRFADGAR